MEILLQRVDEAREHRFRIEAFAVRTRRKRSASPVMASSHFERRRRSSPPVFDPSSSESLLLQNASIKALLSSTVSRVGSIGVRGRLTRAWSTRQNRRRRNRRVC
jgi:hypothetical protein